MHLVVQHMSFEDHFAGGLEAAQVPFAKVFVVVQVDKLLKVLGNVAAVVLVVRELSIASPPFAGGIDLYLRLSAHALPLLLASGQGIPDVLVTRGVFKVLHLRSSFEL